MSFLENYSTVDERIHAFWAKYPNGRIATDIIDIVRTDNGRPAQVIVKAMAWRDITDPEPAAIDFAEETLGSSTVNRTSFIENATTSAIGRCLATLGFSPKKSTGEAANLRPTTIEMTKAQRVAESAPASEWGLDPESIKSLKEPLPKPNFSSDNPKPTPAQMANIEKRAAELKVPATRLDDYLNLILGRDFGTRISKRDASEVIGLDREVWADIAKTMGFGA
jgi:hypothetical protein